MDEAREAAARTGNRSDFELAFGPDQVLMQTVDVEVATERYPEALAGAQAMPARPALPLAARARHMADRAFAYTRPGDDEAALETLMRIKATAPHWLATQRQTQQIVRELRRRAVNRAQLVELTHHVGIR